MAIPGAVPAGLGKRALAAVVDALAAFLLGGAFLAAGAWRMAADGGAGVPWLVLVGGPALAVVGLVQWWYHGRRGATLGKALAGLRTVDAESGAPIGLGRTLLRALVVAAGTLVAGVGQLVVLASPLFDASGRRQGWHDKAARALVVDLALGADPARVRAAEDAATARLDGLLGQVTAVDVPAPAPATPPTPVPPPVPAAGSPGPDAPDRPVTASPIPPTVLADRVPRHAVGPVAPDDDVDVTRLTLVRGGRRRTDRTGRVVLRLWDGTELPLTGTALVGRNPAPRAGEPVPERLVAVPDERRSVSKTHLAVGVDGDGAWVRDRGSTNGTVVTLPDGAQVVCAAGQQVRLPAGATVSFGDYWFTVA